MKASKLGKDQQLMWESYNNSRILKEDLDDDKAHSRAGLAPFSSTHEDEGWPAEDVLEYNKELIFDVVGEWLQEELPNANTYYDVHEDYRNDVPGEVINRLQQADQLMHDIDYDEYDRAIHEFMDKNFEELKDHVEDKQVASGARPPADA